MSRRRLVIISLLLATAVVPWGDGQVRAQSDASVEDAQAAAMERMRERAERVHERRKARISHDERQAVADRAAKARKKEAAPKTPPGQGSPEQGRKGGEK